MNAQKAFCLLGVCGLVFFLGWVSFHVSAGELGPEALGWQISVIDSANNVGLTTSLALQPGTDKPYISYYDNTLDDLKLAFPVSGTGDCGPANTWSCNSLAFQNNTNFGLYSSLDFKSVGQWGIAYQNVDDGTNEFRGIPAQGGQEIFFEPIEEPALIFTVNNSMKFGANDVSQVSYGLVDINQAKGYIKRARYVGQFGNCGYGVWACEIVVETTLSGFVLYNSLTLVGNFPYIFYRDIHQHLAMAVPIPGNCGTANNWECLEIDPTIAVNGLISSHTTYPENDFLGVAYIGNDSLRYAVLVPDGQGNCGSGFYDFRCTIIDLVGTAHPNQLMAAALGSYNGQPIIAYTDNNGRTTSALKIAYPQTNGNCGPLDGNLHYTWRCELVDNGGNTHNVGYYPSLQVDTTGRIHIAYYDLTTGDLKYAVSDTPINPTPTPTTTFTTTPPGTPFWTPTPTLTPTPTATLPPGSLIPWVHLPLIVR